MSPSVSERLRELQAAIGLRIVVMNEPEMLKAHATLEALASEIEEIAEEIRWAHEHQPRPSSLGLFLDASRVAYRLSPRKEGAE